MPAAGVEAPETPADADAPAPAAESSTDAPAPAVAEGEAAADAEPVAEDAPPRSRAQKSVHLTEAQEAVEHRFHAMEMLDAREGKAPIDAKAAAKKWGH